VLAISAAIFSVPKSAFADEDGVSFWIPGFFGSLAATPQQPGWSLTSILYNTNVSASGNAAVAREVTIGEFPKFPVSVTGSANVHADATIGFVAPTYVFATPFLGGQASAALLVGYGNNDTSLTRREPLLRSYQRDRYPSQDPFRSSRTRRALPISFRCFPIAGTPASTITWRI
jgi:hypothetical protein